MRIAVIGIGQSLRGDDAVGLEAVRQWQGKFPEIACRPEVRVEASELPGLGLLDMLEDADTAILVDAVQSTASPGTVHRLTENDLATFTADAKSAHGWGVAETLGMGRLLGKANIPVLLARADTYDVATAVHDITVKLRPCDKDKIDAVEKLIRENVDFKKILKGI